MKKYKIICVLFISMALLTCKGNKTKPADAVKSIKLKFTELGRETQYRITCEKFDYYFPESKVKVLDKKPAIDSLIQMLDNMTPAEEGTETDVRGKIYITHASSKTDTLCVGVKALVYKNITYQTPQALLAIIQK